MSTPPTNYAWTIPSTATLTNHLTKTTVPIPTLSSGQVLIRLTAATLNFRDVLVSTRSPSYPGTHKPSLIPGSDGAGVIHSTHPTSKWAGKEGAKVILHPNTWLTGDVRGLKLDEVYGAFGQDGTLTQWKVADDERIIECDGGLNSGEMASLVTAGTTAWSAIRGGMDGGLNSSLGEWKDGWKEKRLEGKTVLTMGTGGVSCFAIQVCTFPLNHVVRLPGHY
jgi:NADPH:quinone reductase-like Zn-dependent oxidoreductase